MVITVWTTNECFLYEPCSKTLSILRRLKLVNVLIWYEIKSTYPTSLMMARGYIEQ